MSGGPVPGWIPGMFVAILVVSSPVTGGVVLLGAGATAENGAPGPSGIVALSHEGRGIAAERNDLTYVWRGGATRLRGTIRPFPDTERHRICLTLNAPDGGDAAGGAIVRRYGCREETVEQFGTWIVFELAGFERIDTGRYRLVLTVEGGGHADDATLPIYVLDRGGDPDDDGLVNEAEFRAGAGFHSADTDADGLLDGAELHGYGTDPASADTDSDGLRDAIEIQGRTDPTDPDTDGDGLSDGTEARTHGTNPVARDTDGDGLADGAEVGVYDTDPTAADTDGDGESDGVEVLADGTDPLEPNGWWPDRPADLPPDLPASRASGLLVILGFLVVIGLVSVRATGTRRNGGEGAPDGTSSSLPDADMRPPEHAVARLLDRHGGTMPQQDIVDRTDWSKAKVSRTLSRMEADGGAIERVEIGREKLVTVTLESDGELVHRSHRSGEE